MRLKYEPFSELLHTSAKRLFLNRELPRFDVANPQHLTLNPPPSTLDPQPSNLHPSPSALNLEPATLNPQPSTLNPQPSILNPQPSTLNPERRCVHLEFEWELVVRFGQSASAKPALSLRVY